MFRDRRVENLQPVCAFPDSHVPDLPSLVFPSDALLLFEELKEELELEFIGMVDVHPGQGIYQFQYRVVRG